MPNLETLRRPTTLNLPHLEAVRVPDVGGTFNPNLSLTDSIVIARPMERKSPITESQKPQLVPLEVASSLRYRDIPKWDMQSEMSRFINDINFGLEKGLSLEEAVAESTQIFEFHVRGYHCEITKTNPVLLHLNKFAEVGGRTRMVGVNNRPIVESISSAERNGTVLDASTQIDDSLPKARENSFAVLMSPAGWHGFTDQNGNELSPHKNAQVLTFWKDHEGNLKGLTFHTDLNLNQAEEVMEELGVWQESKQGKTEKERIMEVVANPVCLKVPATYENPFDYVLDKMISVRGDHAFRLLQDDGSVELRSIEKVRESIQNFDHLLKGNLEEENLISGLTRFILQNPKEVFTGEFQQQIVDMAEKTILRLARGYLQEIGKIPKPLYEPIIISHGDYGLSVLSGDNFDKEIAFLKTRAGCPPGMETTLALAGYSLGSGRANILGGAVGGGIEVDEKGALSFPCPHKDKGCRKINRRPRGRLISRCGEGQAGGGCGRNVRC